MLNHILEMHQQINDHLSAAADLLAKERAAIRLMAAENNEEKPELFFDNERHRIYWNCSDVILGRKTYLFVKAIWNGENHEADIAEIEDAVWQNTTGKKGRFVSRHTLCSLALRARNELQSVRFPYIIQTVKEETGRFIAGYRIIPMKNGVKR